MVLTPGHPCEAVEVGAVSDNPGMRPSRRASFVLLSAVAVVGALAGTISAATPAVIDYPDFSSVAGLTLDGDAAQAGKALRVVPDASQRKGSAWSQTTLDTTQSFESQFQLRAHDGSVFPADGMTFTVQSQGLAALGDSGGGHGYGGAGAVTPSVAVDLSLFPQLMDGKPEQVAVLENGDTWHPLAATSLATTLYPNAFRVWVDYGAKTHSLDVYVGQGTTKPAAPLVSTTVDLAATVGPAAYAGFTAGTGVLFAAFDVLDWSVEQQQDTTPPTLTCSATPGTLWPPNNKLVPIAVTVDLSDNGSGPAGFTLVSVASDEGDVAAESAGWTTGTPDVNGRLRAGREGSGNGRVYTLTYEGADNAGNNATCSATVVVPHDRRQA